LEEEDKKIENIKRTYDEKLKFIHKNFELVLKKLTKITDFCKSYQYVKQNNPYNKNKEANLNLNKINRAANPNSKKRDAFLSDNDASTRTGSNYTQ